MSLGTKNAVHISFVVRDIKKVVTAWSILLGLDEQPRIWNIPGPETAPTFTNGKAEIYRDCLISVIQLDNLILELVQPGEEESPWKTFLKKHGEGFMHIAFLVPDEEEAKKAIREAAGTDSFYHAGYYPDQTYSFYDTYDVLKSELNIKVNNDNRALIRDMLSAFSS